MAGDQDPKPPRQRKRYGSSMDESVNQGCKTKALQQDVNPDRLALRRFPWECRPSPEPT